MTFNEIVSRICGLLDLTSDTAIDRVREGVNLSYKRIATAIGMETVSRDHILETTTIGSRQLVFTASKLYSVYDPSVSPVRLFDEISETSMLRRAVGTDPPQLYSVTLHGATTITITLDCIPATEYDVGADALIDLSTLSGTDVPSFNEAYHDILIYDASAPELRKKDQYEFADKQEAIAGQRLSDLRYFIAKSNSRKSWAGKRRVMGRTRVVRV